MRVLSSNPKPKTFVPNLVVWVLFCICANLSSGFGLSILIVIFVICDFVNFVKCDTSCRQEDEYWFRYTCPGADSITGVGYYNDLATLFFSVPHQVIIKPYYPFF